jgi:hypothetical protein
MDSSEVGEFDVSPSSCTYGRLPGLPPLLWWIAWCLNVGVAGERHKHFEHHRNVGFCRPARPRSPGVRCRDLSSIQQAIQFGCEQQSGIETHPREVARQFQ